MNATAMGRREAEARIFLALSHDGDWVSRARLEAAGLSGERVALDLAIAYLCGESLVEVRDDGALRLGPRTSPLSAARTASFRRAPGLGHSIDVRATVSSTNDVALEYAAREGVGCTFVAELQTAGRGRRSRAFESPPGLGIWSSTVLDAPAEPALAGRLSLIVAIAVARAVEEATGVRPLLKWPNDVHLAGRKVAGVLVEARSARSAPYPVAGVGINVHQASTDFPVGLRAVAGSLASVTGAALDRSRVLAGFLDHLTRLTTREQLRELDLPRLFSTYDELRERDVTVLQRDRLLRGRARGVAQDGGLLLDVAGEGVLVIHSGEATLAEAEAE